MKKRPTIQNKFDVRKLPPSGYALPGDGKKGKHLCETRWMVMAKVADYGNPDGTSIFFGADTLASDLEYGRDKIFRMLRDLQTLTFVETLGRKGERGPAVRRINFPAMDRKLAEIWARKHGQESDLEGTKSTVLPEPASDIAATKSTKYEQPKSEIEHTKSPISAEQESDPGSDATTQSLPPRQTTTTDHAVCGSGLFATKFVHHSRGRTVPQSTKALRAAIDRLARERADVFALAVDTYLDECPAHLLNKDTRYPMAGLVTNFEAYVGLAAQRKVEAAEAQTKAEREAEMIKASTELARSRLNTVDLEEIQKMREAIRKQGEEDLAFLLGEEK